MDEEIRSFINNAHQEAVKIMNDHRDLLDLMSKELFEKETLGTDDIFRLILDNIDEEHKPWYRPSMTKPRNCALSTASLCRRRVNRRICNMKQTQGSARTALSGTGQRNKGRNR